MRTAFLTGTMAVGMILVGWLAFGIEKHPIDTLDELPPHSYPLAGTAIDLVQSPEGMARFCSTLRSNILTDLETYEFSDRATLRALHKNLFRLDMLEENYEAALALLDQIEMLEEKSTSRLVVGLIPRAIIASKTAMGPESSEASFREAFRDFLENSLENLPSAEIRDRVRESKARAEYLSEALLLGLIESQIQPSATATGALSSDLATRLLHLVYLTEVELPLSPIIADVYSQYLSRSTQPMVDIWSSRRLTPSPQIEAEPVVIGIWDAGVDVTVFPDQMWVNSDETLNGRDDDGNGFVDDLHGIAFGLDGHPSSELLLPLGSQTNDVEEAFEFMQGFWDLVSGIESEAATAARTEVSTLPAGDVGEFINTLSLANHFLHGTHVAGIAVADNPKARILVARATFDHREPPRPLSISTAHRLAESFEKTIAYFASHDVRIVNMSWGFDFEMIESGLTAGGIGESAHERAQMARDILQIMGEALKNAMTANPHILFVTSAGNEDGDVEFDLVVPSSFVLPNLIVVGALDIAGNPTSFTSFGSNVRIYANGYQVDSLVPGGGRMKGSGTSMAAPAVSNLAAKLLLGKPALSPEQLIRLIERGADTHREDPRILRINPRATWDLVSGIPGPGIDISERNQLCQKPQTRPAVSAE